MWNKDEVKGKSERVGGRIKEEIGRATGDEQLEGEGLADQATGNVREGFGTARRKVGEAVKDLGDKLKD